MKRGQINTNFQTRYFVLKGAKLSYFEAPKDESPKGSVDMKGAKLHVDVSNELQVVTVERTYILKAQSNAERDEWMEAMSSHGAVVVEGHNKEC